MQEEKLDIKDEPDLSENLDESQVIGNAVSRNDWEELRRVSLRPGGFGKERNSVW